MINEFSGDGAAEVAGFALNEVKNKFEWRRMYEEIYQFDTKEEEEDLGFLPDTTIPRQLSIAKIKEDFDDELTTDSTQRTNGTLFSLLQNHVQASFANSKYSPTVETALLKASSALESAKEVAISVGVKYGVMKAKEEKIDGPPFANRGQNVIHPPDPMEDFFDGIQAEHRSFLFWWTTLLVGTPLVVTAVFISVTVATDTSQLIPVWLQEVKTGSYLVESDAIVTTAFARAYFGTAVMTRFIRYVVD